MNVFEIKLKVYLINNIEGNHALEEITALIDKCLSRSEKYCDLHNKNIYKLYSFNSFYPVEIDKVNKAGKIYDIVIRTIDKDLNEYLKNNLYDERTKSIKALELRSSKVSENYIEKLYSITPVIVKTDTGYWKNSFSLRNYEERLKINLIKKYNSLVGTKIEEDFSLFTMISFNNKVPIGCDYKNIRLLGDKVDLIIANNENAQKLARMAIGVGIGEMNARGYGFVKYKYLLEVN